ncbi:uncharacterized protein [Nicotiana sylvestris]|uniref:uncharacterized protein n=1 Tax=Nicotiana sylvestris TaxID=4096 RepID=UPI00388C5ABA
MVEVDPVKMLSFSLLAVPWMPHEVFDMADWSRKLAACSTYGECIGDFAERSFPLVEEKESSALGSRTNSKRKDPSKNESACSEAGPAQRLKGIVSAEPVASEASLFGEVVPLLSSSSSPAEGTLGDTGAQLSSSPSIEGTSRDARGQGPPKSSGVSSDHVHIEIGSTGVGKSGPVNARSTFEEAFDKLKSELLRCEARLRKALDGGNPSGFFLQSKAEDLKRLWGEVGRAKHECDELRAQMDAHIAAKEDALAKASALEVQLQNARANSSVRTSIIARLESELLKMKAEVVDARDKAEEIRTKGNKKVVIFLQDAADARAELRGDLDRESRSKEYVRCKSWRETLEEIHAMGFDLLEEIKQAKADEYDAKFLLSDVEDSEKEADGP